MRHRLIGNMYTGLGNPSHPIMDNKWSKNKRLNMFLKNMGKEAIDLYFKELGGFDFQINDDSITIGFEPAYQYDRLKIIHFNKNKDLCYYQTGISFGYYGSEIVSKTRYYGEYVKSSKFKNFIDKWYLSYAESVQ